MPIRVSVKEKPQRKGIPSIKDPNTGEDIPKRKPPKFRRSPDPRSRGEFLTGGQAKLDKNKNNRIDAEDFKILRGEKKKPGKMMKARRGTIIKPRGPGVIRPKPQDRYGQPMKPKPIKPRIQKKMGGGMMKKPMGYTTGDLARDRVLARLKKERDSFKLIKNPARIDQIQKEINELELQKKVDRDATIKKARASIDKIKSKEKDRLTERDMELLRQQAQRLRVNQLKAQGKMGGGMMKKPMGYKKGSKKEMEIKKFVKKHGTFPYVKPKKKMGGGMMMQKPMAYYGGGMMMRPNPIGMKSGKSVKVKCKLGRNKPTKMY
jgi:hypothetical protein